VVGSTSDYLTVANRELLVGQMFTSEQQDSNARVVLLGVNPVATLFGGDAGAALGQQVRIGRSNFTVVGVLTSNRQGDDDVVMPIGAARAYLVGGSTEVNQIIVKATGTNQVTAAETEVETVLDSQHHIKDASQRDFRVTSFQNQLQDMQQTMTFLEIFIVAIAGISLVVGGIGVANIMLVSVTERTREIGIRKAIGARGSAIMKQFLIESTVLAGLGGAVGVVIGVTLTLVAAAVIPTLAPKFGTPDVSALAVVASFAFSLLIGILAGGYPARRASRLRPIEALRFE
jgi:putative ABC transport system permease protein